MKLRKLLLALKWYRQMLLRRGAPVQQARVFIIEDGKILTFLRGRRSRKTGEMLTYYSFPGGEVDSSETIEQAAVRETKEEMDVDIELGPKLAILDIDGFMNHAFSAVITNGVPRLPAESEEVMYSNRYNTYEVRWVPVSELTTENLLYYAKFLPVIQALARGETPSEPELLASD